MYMKRLAALFLLLVLATSAFAGVPLHFGESECGMESMMDMDCCKAALLQNQTPEVADAKLCCTLNCAQNGPTSPPNFVRNSMCNTTSHRPLQAFDFAAARLCS